ncbi:DUF4352 domain-containing protein [Microbispora sp. ATCC PTA-5024]|uniref:DUF4352 domain-containing protein n=1 Tax=Microbispora sp. ATCC PTA-5024 TaxID=316330 RepID=UPI0003DC0202|nr:DUF4352 domain-containing protein [Microbispora sp. ATCC PTA-5024]ETK36091.1 hypothetical protein MPTA5024_10730 [Microbispora sp. ATCC PTA-5024]
MAHQQGPQDPRQWHTQPGQQPQYQQPYGQPPGYGYPPPPPPKKSNAPLILIIIGVGALLLFGGCAAIVALAGNSTPDVVTATAPTATEAQPQDQPQDQPADTTPPGGAPEPVAVGATVSLKGIDQGLKVDVTVTKVVNDATPKNEFTKPQDGNRYVAVEVKLGNTGQAVYDDSPSNGAKLIDDQGQQYNSTFGEVREGVLLNAVTVRPGDSRKGVILFEVPKSTKLAKFQFSLNSGFADQTGEWVLSR